MPRFVVMLLAAATAQAAMCAAPLVDIVSLYGLKPGEAVRRGLACRLRAQILHVSALRPGVYVIGRIDTGNSCGYVMFADAAEA